MAVTDVREIHVGRDGDQSDSEYKVVRSFIVTTNSKRDGQIAVLAAAGIPAMGAAYDNSSESSGNLILRRKRAKQKKESPFVWDVDCEYGVITISGEAAAAGQPTLLPTKYTWQTIQETVDILYDSDDVAVQNSADDPFLDAVTAEKSYYRLVIERNEETFDGLEMSEYVNTLNSTPFFGFAAKECRIASIDATGEYDAIYGGYSSVTYEILIRPSRDWVPAIPAAQLLPASVTIGPWDVTRRNIGTRARPTAGETPEPIIIKGHVATDGADLDTDGTELAAADDPFYWVFKPYNSGSWAALDLE